MLSIEDKIATWLNERPDWMRVLVDHILILGSVDNETLKSLAADLMQKGHRILSTTNRDKPTCIIIDWLES